MEMFDLSSPWDKAAILSLLVLLAYLLKEFAFPIIRRWRLRTPCDLFFVITSKEKYILTYAIQDEVLEHTTRKLIVPSNSEIYVQILLEPRLAFTASQYFFGFKGSPSTRPLVKRWFIHFRKEGIKEGSPGNPPSHYIDHHDLYHIKEPLDLPANDPFTTGFIVQTRGPGHYKAQLILYVEGNTRVLSLPFYVKDKPHGRMRCYLHFFCHVRASPLQVSEESTT